MSRTSAPTTTILFGVGQVATTLHYYLDRDPHYEVVAFTVDRAFMREETLLGVPVVPWDARDNFSKSADSRWQRRESSRA